MTRKVLLALVAALLLVPLVWLAGPEPVTGPSTRSTGARGFSGCFAYLEGRGLRPVMWARGLDALPRPPGLLVLAAPFRQPFAAADEAGLATWLERGGSVVVLASGEPPEAPEAKLLATLELIVDRVPPEPPLGYFSWRAWYARELPLRVAGRWADRGAPSKPVVARARRVRVAAPRGAEPVLIGPELGPGGELDGFSIVRGRGRVLVLRNASIWGNAWIARAGNLDLLEEAVARLGRPGAPLLFDDAHHGLVLASESAHGSLVSASELLLAHLALLYLAALWTLSRPFGAALPPSGGPQPGSVGRGLLALASLHAAGRHGRQAGERLLAHARRLASRAGEPPTLPPAFEGGERELLQLAREVGHLQRDGRLPGSYPVGRPSKRRP